MRRGGVGRGGDRRHDERPKVGLTSSPHNMVASQHDRVDLTWGGARSCSSSSKVAKRGQININTTTYPTEDGEQAYANMHAGKIVGRAVVVP